MNSFWDATLKAEYWSAETWALMDDGRWYKSDRATDMTKPHIAPGGAALFGGVNFLASFPFRPISKVRFIITYDEPGQASAKAVVEYSWN